MAAGVAGVDRGGIGGGLLRHLPAACRHPRMRRALVSSGGLTFTSAPSLRRAKPVVTTTSAGARPLPMTASFSSCCPTVTGRTAALLSLPTT